MSTVSDGLRPGQGDGLTMWTGHHCYTVTAAGMAVFALNDIAGDPAGGPVFWASNAACLFLLYALYADFAVHKRRLCERCIAASPLNPGASVSRWKPALRAAHATRVRKVLVGALVARMAVAHFFPRNPLVLAADAALVLLVGGFAVADRIHHKLYPWCPYCHWGNGGDEEFVPEGDPAPGVTA